MRGWLSRARASTPVRALALLLLALVALGVAAAYALWGNPELRFYRQAARVKLAWLAQLRHDYPHVVIVYGGSTCAFSIDVERMRQRYGLPVANLGLHAGMEPLFLTAFAVAATRPGDTLVVALEPGLMITPFNSPDLAAQMGFSLGHPELIHASNLTGEPIHWAEDLTSLRPGAYHFFTLLGKVLLRRPLYRYHPEDIHPGGWFQTQERRQLPEPDPSPADLSPDSRALLVRLKQWGDTNRVRVMYSVPWIYCGQHGERGIRRLYLHFLQQVAPIMPVLKDPTLGADPRPEDFADSDGHLTPSAAERRTDSLARQLQQQSFWTRAELDQLQRTEFAGRAGDAAAPGR